MWKKTLHAGLWSGIFYMLWQRFQWPFVHSPLNHLFSDPARHYENGMRLLDPTLMGSIDPFLYQFYVWIILTAGNNEPWLIETITGTLCAVMPLFWYLFLRETVPSIWATLGCLVIAAMPSLLIIYGFFMNETLLLNLLGLAFWLTWRSIRVQTASSFTLAAAMWALASITRFVAFPMACACLLYLAWRHKDYVARPLIALACFALISIWPMLHSQARLNVYAPFGYPMLSKIYAASSAKIISFTVAPSGAEYGFSSPALHGPGPLEPLSSWKSARDGTFSFIIDTRKGGEDWAAALQNATTQSPYGLRHQLRDNIVYFFFDESWPDSTERKDVPELYLNRLLRWMWAPLMALIIVALWPFLRARPACDQRFFVLLTLLMIGLMCIQLDGVIEGRYRKPLEPLILIAALLVIRHVGMIAYTRMPSAHGMFCPRESIDPGRGKQAQQPPPQS